MLNQVKATITADGFKWQDISHNDTELDFWSNIDGLEIHANCEYLINIKTDPATIELSGFILSATSEGKDYNFSDIEDFEAKLIEVSTEEVYRDGELQNKITELEQDAYIAH
mgnify:CR=1